MKDREILLAQAEALEEFAKEHLQSSLHELAKSYAAGFRKQAARLTSPPAPSPVNSGRCMECKTPITKVCTGPGFGCLEFDRPRREIESLKSQVAALTSPPDGEPVAWVRRPSGRMIPDLTAREHVCEWQHGVKANHPSPVSAASSTEVDINEKLRLEDQASGRDNPMQRGC